MQFEEKNCYNKKYGIKEKLAKSNIMLLYNT